MAIFPAGESITTNEIKDAYNYFKNYFKNYLFSLYKGDDTKTEYCLDFKSDSDSDYDCDYDNAFSLKSES